jgi:hypothetical protein
MRERVVTLVRQGQTFETAARLAGIHRDTLHEWRRRGQAAVERRARGEHLEARELVFGEFADAVSAARAEAEAEAVDVIWSAMARDWRAAAWYLERSVPEHWGRRNHTEIEITERDRERLTAGLTRGRELRRQAEQRLALPAPATVAERDDLATDHGRPEPSGGAER